MTEHGFGGFGIYAVTDEQGDAGMAQSVELQMAESTFLLKSTTQSRRCVHADHVAGVGGEYEILLDPLPRNSLFLFGLFFFDGAENRHIDRWKMNGTQTADRLGGLERLLLAFELIRAVYHMETPIVQVNVRPAQGNDFPSSKAKQKGGEENALRLCRLIRERLIESFRLAVIVDLNSSLDNFRILRRRGAEPVDLDQARSTRFGHDRIERDGISFDGCPAEGRRIVGVCPRTVAGEIVNERLHMTRSYVCQSDCPEGRYDELLAYGAIEPNRIR